jgi:glycosyltransferase involved in cell wall biosynthesis
MSGRPKRIALIASSRFPVTEPFAGGLEAHVFHLARTLHRRGHRVTLFAAEGSDPRLPVETVLPSALTLSDAARRDVSMPADAWMAEHHAYLVLMLALTGDRAHDFDVVHNHSLHHLPVAMAPAMRRPMLSTLHTPPTPWLESGLRAAGGSHHAVAVSGHTARAWTHVVPTPEVVPNGIDLADWATGPGGGPLVWFGRLVPEKGADLAIDAAVAAGRPLVLAGPVADRPWFDAVIAPRLGDDVRYLGHLCQSQLCEVVGRASATLVSPRWDEPYGLVVAESLACGSPVVAFARGGIPEIVDESCAVLTPPDDVAAMAAAIGAAAGLERAACRRRAESHCSIDAMVDRYEELYDRLAA